MNEEIKQQWLTALRSDEYPQTDGYLRDEQGYCCLGVLCDLAVQAGVVECFKTADDPFYRYNADESVLPKEVIKWAGLDHSDPYVTVEDGWDAEARSQLSELNDSGMSFADIADLIEKEL